jgi:arylsulfatase A-like enzyme
MVQIGDEARPVPFDREPTPVATVERVSPRGGVIRAPVTVSPTGLADGRLELHWAVPDVPRYTRFARLWQLHRHPHRPAHGKIVLESPLGELAVDLALRVERIPPMPVRLESEPFDLSPGATIDVGYGIARPRVSRSASSAVFTATLRCAWAWPRVLVEARVGVSGDPAGRWYDASRRHAPGGRSCRLILEVSHPNGADVGDAVWSIPRLHVSPSGDDRNLVLISLDTLRPDHLSGYDYIRRTSPAIDAALIARGTMFADAITTFPVTNVAHLSIFTGHYPAALPAAGALPAAVPIRMLTEVLRDAGFSTIGITENGLVTRDLGFGWGFDRLIERYHAPIEGAEHVFEQGRQMLQRNRDRRFFLFLHTYKVHAPYTPSDAFREFFPSGTDDAVHRDVPEPHRAIFDDYDRCIREVDAHVRDFLDTLDMLELSDRTFIVLLSDHGEAFGEHGHLGHGFSPREEALRVPLVFRGPGIAAGRRVAAPVSLVDVMPTILDLLGLPVPGGVQGRSLRTALAGTSIAPRVPLFFEWVGAGNVGVRIGSTKIERTGSGHRTFDLGIDPRERAPRPGAAPEHVAEIDRYLEDGARRRQALATAGGPTTISPEVHEALRALGYVQ